MGDYKRVPIPGYEGLYDVDTNGEVFSYYTGKPLSKANKARGYVRVVLFKNGKGVRRAVHILVATIFIPNPDPYKYTQVNHIDGDKEHNCVDNLEWVTARENMRKAVETGLIKSTVRVCALCGKEYHLHRYNDYPKDYCDDCKKVYRETIMPKSDQNRIRQKYIRSKIAELGITKSDIQRVTGKSEYSVSRWIKCRSNYKPCELDVIERELLEVRNE